MSVELNIRFDGDTPGLAEHKLSLAQFSKALDALLTGFRREVNVKLSGELHEKGRMNALVAYADIQIASIEDGCVTLGCDLQLDPPEEDQATLFLPYEDLLEKSASKLFERVHHASKGRAVPAWIRGYLDALPLGVASQRYQVLRDHEVVFETTITDVSLTDEQEPLPGVTVVRGRVVGARFDSKHVVYLEDHDRSGYSCSATPYQVEQALALRGQDITSMILEGSSRRLLWLRPTPDDAPLLSEEDREQYIVDHWREVLAELAK